MLDDSEFQEIREAARAEGTTVSQWVRSALRQARLARVAPTVAERLEVLARATRHRFPAGPIEEMLSEIEQGYHET